MQNASFLWKIIIELKLITLSDWLYCENDQIKLFYWREHWAKQKSVLQNFRFANENIFSYLQGWSLNRLKLNIKSIKNKRIKLISLWQTCLLRPTIRLFVLSSRLDINHNIVVGLCSHLHMRFSTTCSLPTAGIKLTPVWFSEEKARCSPSLPLIEGIIVECG